MLENEKKFLDQKGLEYLWSKINMQDYPNNDTLIAIINAIDENKADRSELIDIDTTLTQSGQAADAQITGDRIKALDALAVKIEEQILTEEQKKQVRENIGAGIPLPENVTANQVLTTNSEGITVWEDKPFYDKGTVSTAIFENLYFEWPRAGRPGTSFETPLSEFVVGATYQCIGTHKEIDFDFTFIPDNTQNYYTDSLIINEKTYEFEIDLYGLSMNVAGDGYTPGNCTISLYQINKEIVQLDTKYIPAEIARITDITKAVATIVARAPEDFDTLKEIADWIANDETGTLNLIGRVEKAEADIEDLKPLDVQADWKQTDETAMDFIKNKPNEDDALALLAETGLIDPITAADGSVFTDSNGALYSL